MDAGTWTLTSPTKAAVRHQQITAAFTDLLRLAFPPKIVSQKDPKATAFKTSCPNLVLGGLVGPLITHYNLSNTADPGLCPAGSYVEAGPSPAPSTGGPAAEPSTGGQGTGGPAAEPSAGGTGTDQPALDANCEGIEGRCSLPNLLRVMGVVVQAGSSATTSMTAELAAGPPPHHPIACPSVALGSNSSAVLGPMDWPITKLSTEMGALPAAYCPCHRVVNRAAPVPSLQDPTVGMCTVNATTGGR